MSEKRSGDSLEAQAAKEENRVDVAVQDVPPSLPEGDVEGAMNAIVEPAMNPAVMDEAQSVADSGIDAAAVADEPEAPPAPPTPGQLLREARLARKLSLDDVADILRFSPRQIALLEDDRYDALPGATLVRGFIRGYAKLLKLDPVPLLAALTPEVPPTVAEVRPPKTICEADDVAVADRAKGKPVSWGSIGAALVLVLAIGLVAFLFLTKEPGSTVLADTKPQESTQAGVAPPVVVSLSAPQENATPTDPTQPPPPALVAEFDDRSWIEVRDATQKVVYVGEYPKGTRQVITGKAPFQIWIGRASVVRLTYGERSVDLKPHSREDVARLVVE